MDPESHSRVRCAKTPKVPFLRRLPGSLTLSLLVVSEPFRLGRDVSSTPDGHAQTETHQQTTSSRIQRIDTPEQMQSRDGRGVVALKLEIEEGLKWVELSWTELEFAFSQTS